MENTVRAVAFFQLIVLTEVPHPWIFVSLCIFCFVLFCFVLFLISNEQGSLFVEFFYLKVSFVSTLAWPNEASIRTCVLIGECWRDTDETNSKWHALETNYRRLTRPRETIQFAVVYLWATRLSKNCQFESYEQSMETFISFWMPLTIYPTKQLIFVT